MATRDDIVQIARGQLGYHQGQGYDEPNKYTALYLGPAYGMRSEGGTQTAPWYPAYCDIFVSWCFHQAGIPLPYMGGMISEGQQYCPSSWAYAQAHGAARAGSWEAQPADQVIFNWNGDSQPLGPSSHTELVISYDGTYLYTIGGNSGPAGGVNQHAWYCPPGVGNSVIQGVIDTSRLVTFSDSEEFVMDAEAERRFDQQDAKIDQLIKILEGGLPASENPYGIVGTRDLWAGLKKIGAKVGVRL